MTIVPGTRVSGQDDVTSGALSPADRLILYYYDGIFRESTEILHQHAPNALLVPICVSANDAPPKDCKRAFLDDEPGDANNSQILSWYHRAKDNGCEGPGDYTSISNARSVIGIMDGAGLKYGVDWFLWTAHYTGVPHLCNPSCGFGMDRTAHGTQWFGSSTGAHPDQDLFTAIGCGLFVPAPPDPNHYARYDDIKRHVFDEMSEEELARKYDRERERIRHFEPHGGTLARERDLCAKAVARLTTLIDDDRIRGIEQPQLFYRGWRREMFRLRAAGHNVLIK